MGKWEGTRQAARWPVPAFCANFGQGSRPGSRPGKGLGKVDAGGRQNGADLLHRGKAKQNGELAVCWDWDFCRGWGARRALRLRRSRRLCRRGRHCAGRLPARGRFQPGYRRRQGGRRGPDRRPALCDCHQRKDCQRPVRHRLRPQPGARPGLLHRHGVRGHLPAVQRRGGRRRPVRQHGGQVHRPAGARRGLLHRF